MATIISGHCASISWHRFQSKLAIADLKAGRTKFAIAIPSGGARKRELGVGLGSGWRSQCPEWEWGCWCAEAPKSSSAEDAPPSATAASHCLVVTSISVSMLISIFFFFFS